MLDSELMMLSHMNKISLTLFYYLRCLRQLGLTVYHSETRLLQLDMHVHRSRFSLSPCGGSTCFGLELSCYILDLLVIVSQLPVTQYSCWPPILTGTVLLLIYDGMPI